MSGLAGEHTLAPRSAEPSGCEGKYARALAFDAMTDAVLITDDARRYVDANPAAGALFGVPADQVLGRRIEDFATLPADADLAGAWAIFLEAGHQEGAFPLLRADGARRLIEYRALANLTPGRHLWVLRDITERFEHEQQYVKLANNLPYVVSRFDRARRHLFVNAAFTRVTSKPPSEVLGRRIEDVGLAPALLTAWKGAIDEALAGTESTFSFQRQTPQGLRSFSTRMVPENAADGTVESVLAITRDVTDEERAERERAELLRREHLAREEAERASRLAEQFVAVLGHDLRSPLSAILSGAYLIAQKADDENLRRVGQRVETSALRMSRLIEQLLDYSRIRNGKGLPHEPRRVELAEVLLRVRDEVAIGGRVVELELLGDTLGTWDADRLAQVFSNLLLNAVEHSPPGSAVQVRVDGRASERLVVTVDNPGAIPPELQAEIFEPFRQGRPDDSGSRGLGLGLFISKQVVLNHGGTIEVSSSEAAGTRFTVTLPRAFERQRA